MFEQPLLPPQTAAVAAERAVGADYTMTRDNNANHVRAVGPTDGAPCIAIAIVLEAIQQNFRR